jgi:hypothetical protein
MTVASVAASAPPTTQVVTDNDVTRQAENTPPTDNWVLYTRNAGDGAFVQGPATAPLGVGSLQFTTPTGADKVFLFNYDYAGTALADIDAISYATYRTSGSLQQDTALNIEVDYNGAADGGFTTLVFEPVYNTDQGSVVSGQWQTWDAYNGGQGRWWSTKGIPGVCAFDCFVAWDSIIANNPDAVIGGGFGVNQGSGNPGLIAATDALTLGVNAATVVYDFEPLISPSSADECKNGGWQTFNDPVFKNQGQCVSSMHRPAK